MLERVCSALLRNLGEGLNFTCRWSLFVIKNTLGFMINEGLGLKVQKYYTSYVDVLALFLIRMHA